MKPATILFFMEEAAIGGVRRVTEILTNAFEQRHHKVYWLMQRHYYGDDRDYPSGYNCNYLPNPDLCNDESIKFYQRFVVANDINIVMNQNGLYGANAFLSQSGKNIKLYSVLHNNPLLNTPWLWRDILTLKNDNITEKFKRVARILLYKKIKRDALKPLREEMRAASTLNIPVVTLSPSYNESVKYLYPNVSSVTAIPNPNTYRGEVVMTSAEKIVLYVGRLYNRSKKLDYLIKIWKRIYKSVPDWRLVIVGEGPDEALIKKMAGNIDTIVFKGYQDPKFFYERASILCMTSIFEGFPMVLTEAMQHGCVPIAFDSFPAIHDIIRNDEDGVIVKSFDLKEYSNKLLQLIRDYEYRQRLSENAINNVKRFDIVDVVDKWEALFDA